MTVITLIFALHSLAAPAPAPLTDAQISRVLQTLNEGEIDAAKIAMKRARKEGTRNFAKMMRNEHVKKLQDTKDVTKKANLGTEKSELSESLETAAKNDNTAISKATKDAFDLAYLEEQVEMHQKALETIRKTLIPAAHNEDLKRLLEDTRKHVESHLAMAKAASANVGSGAE